MTFYGQEKTEYNANLCRMNIAVHNLNAQIRSGEEANTYYNIPFPLVGACDYVMAIPCSDLRARLLSLPCISSQIRTRTAC